MNYPSSSFRSFSHASPPTPRLYHQVDDPTDESVPMVPALKSSQKASAQGVVISKRPEGLHFLRTPCSLRSLLPDQAYYTKFGACNKSTNSQEPKSSQRLRKVSFDLVPQIQILSEEPK
mmetsp:Transcript_8746/g.13109  ORF Transcript_8746/g.13109 Transcript_8746/m.13109 type:complete len:119 (+) Transcript_8746:165-521(+)|eukprot:scaffold4868_cov148-Skeletonema_dohrnii-CCMP3373.AAC.3